MIDQLKYEKYGGGNSNQLIYVHIGKCGGATVNQSILHSELIKSRFRDVIKVHTRKPFYQKSSQYLFVIRNPISRALSAFNWRYRLVVETKEQEFRFSGEYEILEKYNTLNNMAEQLYINNAINLDVVKEWFLIHHLKEDIAYYLDPLLPNLRTEQIFAILRQENLNDDIYKFLEIKNSIMIHSNAQYTNEKKNHLSTLALKNLNQFLQADYKALETLIELSGLNRADFDSLLNKIPPKNSVA